MLQKAWKMADWLQMGDRLSEICKCYRWQGECWQAGWRWDIDWNKSCECYRRQDEC